MRLFYLTALDDLDREKCGILGKIYGQIHSFEQNSFHVSFGHFHGKDCFLIKNDGAETQLEARGANTRDRMGSIYEAVKKYIMEQGIQALYIRFISLDGRAIQLYQYLHEHGVRIIIEFYSHNLELEAQKTAIRNFRNGKLLTAIKGVVSLNINRVCFYQLRNCIDLIVTTTPVDSMYGVPTLNVRNGIDTEAVQVRKKTDNGYDFNIISVAMISSWHGYDRMIKGIADYYHNGGNINILYSVIGDGEEKCNLEQLVKNNHLEEHVVFTGIKLANELDEYYNHADVALEMLAGFRRTKGSISSIKMAEYFAKGIPVVCATEKQQYSEEIQKYCFLVENDDSNVNIDGLIRFITSFNGQYDRVCKEMHHIAKEQFDWSFTMQPLFHLLRQNDQPKA